MRDPGLDGVLGLRWNRLDHRFARSHLERFGWVSCGRGDWAYVYRSPGGRYVARVSPFEPAYGYFVQLCGQCADNRYLPRMQLAAELEGGGHLAVLEYLAAPDREIVAGFLRRWRNPRPGDVDLWLLRRAVETIDRQGRQRFPGWVGVDIGDRHVLVGADGHPKVIDLFGVDLRTFLLGDPGVFARCVPADRRRYVLDMPDLQDEDQSAEYVCRIRAVLEQADHFCGQVVPPTNGTGQ